MLFNIICVKQIYIFLDIKNLSIFFLLIKYYKEDYLIFFINKYKSVHFLTWSS